MNQPNDNSSENPKLAEDLERAFVAGLATPRERLLPFFGEARPKREPLAGWSTLKRVNVIQKKY